MRLKACQLTGIVRLRVWCMLSLAYYYVLCVDFWLLKYTFYIHMYMCVCCCWKTIIFLLYYNLLFALCFFLFLLCFCLVLFPVCITAPFNIIKLCRLRLTLTCATSFPRVCMCVCSWLSLIHASVCVSSLI